MISNRLRCSGAGVKHRSFISAVRDRRYSSFQFKLAAIEGHHLVNIRDVKLMHARPVILPDIDGILTFGCDPCARHIRCLTDFEQRQTVAGFQVTSLAIKSNAEFDDRPFILSQRIADQAELDHVRFTFH